MALRRCSIAPEKGNISLSVEARNPDLYITWNGKAVIAKMDKGDVFLS